jgi:hypothetical protein
LKFADTDASHSQKALDHIFLLSSQPHLVATSQIAQETPLESKGYSEVVVLTVLGMIEEDTSRSEVGVG